MPNALGSYGFPDSYNDIVTASASVKYVSSSGNNGNNGNTVTTPYLTIAQALTATSATATSVTIVVLSGTYDISATSLVGGNAAACIVDGGNPRVFVCAPGAVIINCTDATGVRDFSPLSFSNSNSAIYGATLSRNNGARSTSYSTAFINDETASFKGKAYNTVFREVNTNNMWSVQYDNSSDSTAKIYNSTFYVNAPGAGDWSGSTGCVITDTVFNNTYGTSSASFVGCLTSQTVNPTTYVTTGVTLDGVYSGVYAWNGTNTGATPASTAIIATGGTITTTTVSGVTIKRHTFTTSGSFVVSSAAAGDGIEFIVVGGGGGGTYNNYVGSGGGGAAVNYGNSTVTATTYTITIGSGGAAKTGGSYGGGSNGGTSSLIGGSISLSSLGGPGSGMNGNPDATGTYTFGTGTSYAGAGAGGAGQVGQGSNGGNGRLITSGLFSTNTTYYGGGGAGGLAAASGLTSLTGGLGGGAGTTLSGGQAATLNSGGGGAGGSAAQSTLASSGADGTVIIVYTSTLPNGVYASSNSVTAGSNVTFTLRTANTGNIPYTITGITADIINNAALTGNFVVSGGLGTLTFTTKSVLSSTYSMSLTSESSTANVSITPNVSITTTMIGIGYAASSTYLGNPITAQMNIPDSIVTVAQYNTGGSSQSAYPVAGQMNIFDSVVTANNAGLSSQPLLPTFSNLNSNVSVPYTTITTSTAGPIQQGIVKLFGDLPQREFWV